MILLPNTFRHHWMSYVKVLEKTRQTPTRSMLIVFIILTLFLTLNTGWYLVGVVMPSYQVTSQRWSQFFLSSILPRPLRTEFTLIFSAYLSCSLLGYIHEWIQFKKQIPAFIVIFTKEGRQRLSRNQQKFEKVVNKFFYCLNWILLFLQIMCFLFFLTCCITISNPNHSLWAVVKSHLIWTILPVTTNLGCVYGYFCFQLIINYCF